MAENGVVREKSAQAGGIRCWQVPWMNSVHAGCVRDARADDESRQGVLLLRTGQQVRRFRAWAAA